MDGSTGWFLVVAGSLSLRCCFRLLACCLRASWINKVIFIFNLVGGPTDRGEVSIDFCPFGSFIITVV